MKLSFIERLKLMEILPRKGDFETVKIAQALRKSLIFTESENIEFGVEAREPGHCENCGYIGFAAPDDSCPRSIPVEGEIPECQNSRFMKTGEQQITWNVEAARDAEIKIKAIEKGVVVKALNELSKKGDVTDQHLTLFEKFIGG